MVDRYTKSVLTIIAVALVAIVVQNAVRPLQAQGLSVQKVAICDYEHCAKLQSTGYLDGVGRDVFGISVIQRKPQ